MLKNLRIKYWIFSILILINFFSGCQSNEKKITKNEIVIKFWSNADSNQIDSLIKEMGIEKIKIIPKLNVSVYKITTDQAANELINKYKDHPVIEYIEPNYKVNINQ